VRRRLYDLDLSSDRPSQRYELQPLTFSQAVGVDSYKATMTGALAAADSVADKVVTAAVSFATAYGAVIALVTPKDAQTPWQVAVPFAPLATAVGLALYAQSIGISVSPKDDVDVVLTNTTTTIDSKRRLGRWALYALVVALLASGYVVYTYYGPSAKKDTPAQVTLYLTPAGTKAVSVACGKQGIAVIRGSVKDVGDLAAARVPLHVTKQACPSGGGTLLLPQQEIAATKR
jgi:hypothetical protein